MDYAQDFDERGMLVIKTTIAPKITLDKIKYYTVTCVILLL